MAVEDLARQVFEELDLGLSHYMWYEYVGHLDEFLEVLFLMYFACREPNAQGWFSTNTNDSTYYILY